MLALLNEGRAVIACVGTELRGDDRVGLEFCRELRSTELGHLVVECPFGLEMCSHIIEEMRPTTLIVVDAALLPEGTDFVLASPTEIEELVALSTHSLPISIVAKFLREEVGIREIVILGIAVERLELSTELSPRASLRLRRLLEALCKFMQRKIAR